MSESEKKDARSSLKNSSIILRPKMDSRPELSKRGGAGADSFHEICYRSLAEPLASQEENTCDHKLVRFLRGYEHNEEAAVKAYREYLSFRAEFGMIRRERCRKRDITHIPTCQSMRRFVGSSPRV